MNFPPRQIGKFTSEVLTLGFADPGGAVVVFQPYHPVSNVSRLFWRLYQNGNNWPKAAGPLCFESSEQRTPRLATGAHLAFVLHRIRAAWHSCCVAAFNHRHF